MFWDIMQIKYTKNVLPDLVNILSFDNTFLETDIARGRIVKCDETGIIHNWTLIVDLG